MSAIVFAFSCLALATNGQTVAEDLSSQSRQADPRGALGELLLASNAPTRLARNHRTPTARMGLDSLRVSQPFPAAALQRFGVKGKKAVLFFYDGEEKPSCKQQISAFSATSNDFKKEGFTIVGIRSALGGKSLLELVVGTSGEGEVIQKTQSPIKFVVDEDDELRNEIGIEEDLFGLLGAFTRATYVVDRSGYIVDINTDQLDAASHAKIALAAVKKMQPAKGARTKQDMERSLFNLGFAVPQAKRR